MKNKVKNKKGVSEVLGYLLLVSFAIFMSFIVYQGLKIYVPVKAVECPEGVSIFVQSAKCSLSGVGKYNLELNIKNNGRYNIAGYYIHASNSSEQEVATIPLIGYLDETTGNIDKMGNAVIFGIATYKTTGNFVNISSTAYAEYENIPKISSLDILPIRFQEEDNRLKLVSCGKATVREKINCA